MEEILASIRRIIADDDAAKAPKPEPAKPAPVRAAPPPSRPAPAAAAPPPPPPAPPPASAGNSQDDIDAMLAGFDAPMEKPSVPEPAQNDILDLTEAMATPEPARAGPTLRAIDGRTDLGFDSDPPMPDPARAPNMIQEARRQFHETTGSDRSLLSPATTSAVDSAFNTLAQTVLVQNSQTLDGLVREMLRPMLKAWLDDNLPTLVERLVRAEIERVSRGRS
jgi:cell pole-organizing protein PopZ